MLVGGAWEMNGQSTPSAQPPGSALMGVPRRWALAGWVRGCHWGKLLAETDHTHMGRVALTWPADSRAPQEAPVACPVLGVHGRDGREPFLKAFWEDFSGQFVMERCHSCNSLSTKYRPGV